MEERSRKRGAKHVPLPTKEQVLAFIRESEGPVGKREIARAFHLKGADRIPLKAMLKELEKEGQVDRGRKRQLAAAGVLPEVTVVQVIGPDADGDLWARPVDLRPDDAEPKIVIIDDRKIDRPLGAGDRVLVQLKQTDADVYEARAIRRLQSRAQRVVGLFEKGKDGFGRLVPTDKRIKTEFSIHPREIGSARTGDLVIVEAEPARRLGTPKARVVERIGRADEPRSISLISVAEHQIPFQFSPAALTQAKEAGPATLGKRTDLRDVPLVTIDGDDARDFDDAVFAEPDKDAKNLGGWRLVIAIADVAHYVRAGDALDKAARERGNSVYFPDRVVPMLPEELSNGWCSLKPNEDRPCMAVEIIIDANGNKLRHRFMRGLMRSQARLTYEQVQAAHDGRPNDLTGPVLKPIIEPLYGAFRALLKAREARGTLDLDIPERRVFLGEDGHIDRIVPRSRLDSHRLIEEFMIAANVAAAEALEKRRQPCMYRVHEPPDPARVEALRQFVDGLGLKLARGQVIRPKHFTRLLEQATKTPYAAMIHTLTLRSQMPAVYAPGNLGHFGLALQRYAHFTSPIRRYSDLLVHRALISAYGFGNDGLPTDAAATFEPTGQHISATERRAAAAERDAIDRYVAHFMAERVGENFDGRVSGVARFGLFVTLEETGADGLLPVGMLPPDFYDHDERSHALVGRRNGRVFQLGAQITVRLAAAQPLTGGLSFELVAGGSAHQDDRAVRKLVGEERRTAKPRVGVKSKSKPKPMKSRAKRRRRD
ncbi:ribonuclease R [Dongia deserti]|uniref:ribonuclease R n=1 Tax=Dongia deserti TaxID=2268030 RepID=UPI000E654DD1|nr:ribonuclease R [Dongia deserti]